MKMCAAVRRGFDEIWERPVADRETDHLDRPLGIITQQMDNDIHRFQKENDLKVDGYMRPRGETINALVQKVAAKQVSQQAKGKSLPSSSKPPAKTQDQELAVPAPPAYRKEVFQGKRRQEWEDFYRNVENRKDLSQGEKRMIQDIFAAEGGMDVHSGSGAFAGVLPSTLEKHIEQGKVPDIVAKHGDKVKNTDLDADDLVEIYKSHLNDSMSSAIKGYNDRNPKAQVDATKLLEKLGDKVGGAVADTLFKNAGKEGSEIIIKAINKTLPQANKLASPSGFGSETYSALEKISRDKGKSKAFLESLAVVRVSEELNGKNEKDRIYYPVLRK